VKGNIAPALLIMIACLMAGGRAHGATEGSDATPDAHEAAGEAGAAPAASHESAKSEAPAEGETSEEQPPPPSLWPEKPAVELEKQPYILVRAMRALQDEIAAGSATAHQRQRQVQREIAEQMRHLPPEVWDDIRNVRAAIYFVLGGGEASVLKPILGRPKTPHLERRLLRGTLAYGEGRLVDALGMIHKQDARKLDPLLGGIVALIQGTLVSKKDMKKAIALFDEARLLSPGTLIEEAALRQQILLLAREGDLARFDVLSAQYSRRFPRSLFAQNFRRQFLAGVARQSFKPPEEWVARTENEIKKAPEAERVGLYLAIADEATKGGSVGIARFAAGKARELAAPGSRALQRAMLYEGASLVATEDFEKGLELLNTVDLMKLTTSERQIHSSAVGVAMAVGKWPVAAEALDEEPPEAVGRAQALLTKVDSLLGGLPQ
jgi:chemotaxis protein MotC